MLGFILITPPTNPWFYISFL